MASATISAASPQLQTLQMRRAAPQSRPAATRRVPVTPVSVAGCSSLRGTPLVPRAPHRLAAAVPSRRRVAVGAGWNRGSNGPDATDRVAGALPYLLPLLDGLRYGKFFLIQFPQFGALLLPLDPLIRFYYSFPFASIIVFFGVYLGIINNQNFSRYVRFNAMQAVLLDIILILPGLLESVFRPPMGGAGLQIYISLYNTIFLFLFACVAYGVGSCMVGQTARLPLVADAADAQVR